MIRLVFNQFVTSGINYRVRLRNKEGIRYLILQVTLSKICHWREQRSFRTVLVWSACP